MSNPSEEKLIRAVGLTGIIAITINAIIGAGIFVLPANIARLLGEASPIAFVGAGLLSMIIAACFAELAGKFDRTGGAYLYAHEAYGGAFAFVIGWMYFLARLTSVAALSNALVGFCGFFFSVASPVRETLIVSLLTILGIINILGIRFGARLINSLTVIKLFALSAFIVAGMMIMKWEVFSSVKFPPVNDVSAALLLAIFAFSGFEVVSIPGGEVIHPKRNVPLGLLIGTGITISVYLLIQMVAVGTFPGLAASQAPLADAAQLSMGSKGAVLLTAGAVFSTIGTLTSLLLMGPRILYAMSLNRQMPMFFSRVHAKYRTPYLAIGFYTILGIFCSLSSTFQDLATLSAMARLVTYIGCAAAVLILRKKLPSSDTFRIPGGPLVPILAILLSLFLFTAATQKHMITGSMALGAGLILYFVTGRSPGKT